MNHNYFNKYIKYKKKYLDLKNSQYSGSSFTLLQCQNPTDISMCTSNQESQDPITFEPLVDPSNVVRLRNYCYNINDKTSIIGLYNQSTVDSFKDPMTREKISKNDFRQCIGSNTTAVNLLVTSNVINNNLVIPE